MKKKRPQSLRKHIRYEKARIRRDVLSLKKQKELIVELYQKLIKQPKKASPSSPPSLSLKAR